MISIEEAHDLLDEVADELPEEFWHGLNGGVSLLPDVRRSAHAVADDLYTLGEYRIDPVLGRYINIYFGSFEHTYAGCSREQMKSHLRRVLFHEFTHHVESLAGERGLEIKDARQLHAYQVSHSSGGAEEDDAYDIRPATEADLPHLHALYDTFFAEMAALAPRFYRETRQDEDFLRSILRSEEADVLVAADADGAFALALVKAQQTQPYGCLVPHRYALLMDIVVSPEERGQGIGHELVDAARDWARAHELEYLQLQVLTNNQSAIRFYAREGFSPLLQDMIAPL